MARLRGVIFDLDGTLADTMGLCYAAFIDVFARFAGRTFTAPEVRAMFGPSEEGVIQRVVPEQWDACLEAYLDFYRREHANYARGFPGVDGLLCWLKDRGFQVGIVTGKGPRSAAITIEQVGIGEYVDALRSGSAAGPVKPAAIGEVLSEWGTSPEEVAYVGDSPSDMRSSRQVGTIPLGAAWGPGTSGEALLAAGAVEVFPSVDELRAWLGAHHGWRRKRAG